MFQTDFDSNDCADGEVNLNFHLPQGVITTPRIKFIIGDYMISGTTADQNTLVSIQFLEMYGGETKIHLVIKPKVMGSNFNLFIPTSLTEYRTLVWKLQKTVMDLEDGDMYH